MVQIFDSETNTLLGTITDSQLRFLSNELEEESATDQDYYLESATVDLLEQDGADAPLVALLRTALAGRDGVEVRWVRSGE